MDFRNVEYDAELGGHREDGGHRTVMADRVHDARCAVGTVQEMR
jgi:hypothetical protein